MSLLVLLGVCFGGAALAVGARRSERGSMGVGLLALVIACGLSIALPTATGSVGGEPLVADPYARFFVAFGLAAGLLISLLGLSLRVAPPGFPDEAGGARERLAARSHRAAEAASADAAAAATDAAAPRALRMLPAAILLVLGCGALALSLEAPVPAILVAASAGFAALLAFGIGPGGTRLLEAGRSELRAAAIAGALAIAATAALTGAADPLGGRPLAVGVAYLAAAGAVALRFGLVPFHRVAVAPVLASASPAIPVLAVWAPVILGLVILGSLSRALPNSDLPLSLERGVVVGVGVLSVAVGVVAAWLQDDIDHLVAYSIVQDGGFALLAGTTLDPAGWAAGRLWLLAFALSKTAFVAWAIALRSSLGSGRIPELAGWIRRAPLLALALLALVVATLGVPGLAVWDARRVLASGSVTEPLSSLVLLAGLASLVYYGRLVVTGVRAPSSLVADMPSWLPRLPPPLPVDESVAEAAEVAGDRASPPRPRSGGRASTIPDLRLPRRSPKRSLSGRATALWRANGAPVAAALVLALALVALAGGGGALGLADAAAATPSVPSAPASSGGPSFQPVATEAPTPGESTTPGASAAPHGSTPGASTPGG